VLMFLFVTLLIRHLGPTASLSISSPYVIISMGLLVGGMNIRYGGAGFLLGCIMGASLGAVLNIVSYFTYSLINQNIVAPVLKYITKSYTEQMSYAGWGVIGVYLGGTLSLFRRRAWKKIVGRRA
jgi:hypothetical protein